MHVDCISPRPADARFKRSSGWLAVLLAAAVLASFAWRREANAATARIRPGISVSSDYASWRDAVAAAPSYRSLRGRVPAPATLPFRSIDTLLQLAQSFAEQCATNTLAQPEKWVAGTPPKELFFDPLRSYLTDPAVPFQPFVQKLVLPAGSEVVFQGDLHGDVRSLLATCDWLQAQGFLDGFTLARTNTWMVFLGDYTDRGVYGAEVLYTLLRLRLANPDRVVLLRGNHEDYRLVAQYGFLAELQQKFPGRHDLRPLLRVFDFLPVALYLGHQGNFIQCNHGGLEPGFDPRDLLQSSEPQAYELLGELRQASFLESQPAWQRMAGVDARADLRRRFVNVLPTSPTTPITIGFMWNDFTLLATQPEFESDPDRALVYGQRATRELLRLHSDNDARLRAVFRGHQHAGTLDPMMSRLVASGGLYRHWQSSDNASLLMAPVNTLIAHLERAPERPIPDGSVWTFNVTPDSLYGQGCGFTSATLGILRMAERFEDWRIQAVEVQVSP